MLANICSESLNTFCFQVIHICLCGIYIDKIFLVYQLCWSVKSDQHLRDHIRLHYQRLMETEIVPEMSVIFNQPTQLDNTKKTLSAVATVHCYITLGKALYCFTIKTSVLLDSNTIRKCIHYCSK